MKKTDRMEHHGGAASKAHTVAHESIFAVAMLTIILQACPPQRAPPPDWTATLEAITLEGETTSSTEPWTESIQLRPLEGAQIGRWDEGWHSLHVRTSDEHITVWLELQGWTP